MIIVFNFIGAGILVLAGGIACLVGLLFADKTGGTTVLVGGLGALALDVAYRMKVGEGSLLHPRKGGHVCFVPAWMIGVGFLAMGGFGFTSWIPELSGTRQSAPVTQANISAFPTGPRPGYQAVPIPSERSYTALKLNMISGTGARGLALINGENFAVGEKHTLTVAQKKLTVTCLEISDHSVVAKIDGESRPRVLQFGESKALAVAR